MSEKIKISNILDIVKWILKILKPRFSFHYFAYTTLTIVVVFSILNIAKATTPNPGHPWSQVGDGVFAVTNNQTGVRTYTFPDADATVLTTNAAVTLGQGGTGSSLVDPNANKLLAWDDSDNDVRFITLGTNLSYDAGTDTLNASGSAAWNSIAAPTGTQSLTFDDAELNAWTISSDTETFHTYTANSLTTGKILSLSSSSLTSGTMLDISSSGTAANTGQKGLNISLAGTNGSSGKTTYGAYLSNTHAGSGTNVGLYSAASGGTNNYAAIFENGYVGIGTITPLAPLNISNGSNHNALIYSSSFVYDRNNESMYEAEGIFIAQSMDTADITDLGDNASTSIFKATDNIVFNTTASTYSFGLYGFHFAPNINITSGASTKNTYGFNFNPYQTACAAGTCNTVAVNAANITDGSNFNSTAFKVGTGWDYGAIFESGKVGVGVTSPTATLHLKAGTATAGTAPLKFTAGTNMTNAEAGAMEWDGTNLFITQTSGPTRKTIAYTSDITGGSWNTITSPTGTQSLTFDDGELNAWTVSSDTETFHTYTANSLTTGKILSLASSSLTSGSLLDLSSAGTGALTGQKGLNISLSGTNGTGAQTTYGTYISNAHAGTTSTNVGLYASATNGTTANYAAIFENGYVGIGTTAPSNMLHISKNMTEPLLIVENTGGSGGSGFQFIDSLSSSNFKIKAIAGGGFKIRDETNTMDVFTIENNSVANALYIDSGGNIGIRDTSPDGTLDIDSAITSGIDLGITNTGVYTGTGLFNVTANSATTGVLGLITANGLSSGSIFSLDSNGTAALTGQKGLNISLSGTNGSSSQATYGAYLSNTHAGSGTNVGLYTTASGGSTNLGLNVDSGQSLLGGTTLTSGTLAKLNIVSTMASNGSTTAIAGIHGEYTFNNGGASNYVQVGNRFVFNNAPTTNSNTMAGEIIRTVDNTSLANLVRGIDITSNAGSNTAGTNTGLRAIAGTFGVQGITSGLAGGVSVPAALYGESTNDTQGDVLRLYSTYLAASNQTFATFYQDSSTFTGTGLLMNFAAGSGTFSGDYLHFKNGGTPRFKVTSNGVVSMGLSSTSATTAVCSSLANATSPTSGTAYEIRDCSGTPVADYAESYPVSSDVEYGDIVVLGKEMINTYDTKENGEIDWNKVKGQVAQLVKSEKVYQKEVIGIVSDNYGDFSSVGYNIKEEDNPMPVALSGRVPVKISEFSEPIEIGDFLTTSNEPGKATKAEKTGQVIGKALESWNPDSGQEMVMLYVEQGFQNGESIQEHFAIDLDSVNEDGSSIAGQILAKLIEEEKPLDDSLSEVLTDRLVAGLEVITPSIITNTLQAEGEVNFNGLTYFNENTDFAKSVKFNDQAEFAVPPLFNNDTAGFAVIKEGDRSVRVSFDEPYLATPVVTTNITFEKIEGEDFDNKEFFSHGIESLISEKDQTGFTITINQSAPRDINFSWIALAVKDPKIFESVIDGLILEEEKETEEDVVETTNITTEITEDPLEIIPETSVIEENITEEEIIPAEENIETEKIKEENILESTEGQEEPEAISEPILESISETTI